MRTPRPISLVLPPRPRPGRGRGHGGRGGAAPKGPKELAGLEYRLVGPPAGGRVSRVAGVPGDPLTYYAATASGGVWKSTDGGIRWKPVFDDQPIASIGSIAVAPSDPNVVYVGSGEANIRGNVAAGQRHLQVDRRRQDLDSTSGSRTARSARWSCTRRTPTSPSRRCSATPSARTPSAASIARATAARPGSRSSTKDADTGASDVALDPQNPRIVFAGLWQARRRPVGADERRARQRPLRLARRRRHLEAARRARGCPRGSGARSASRSRRRTPQRVYALIEAEKGGLFRSDDGGETLDARERPPRAAAAGLVLLDAHRRSARTPTSSGSRRCRC